MPEDTKTRLLKAAERLAGVGHWQLDIPANTLFWSDEVYRIHGYRPGEFTPTLEAAVAAYHPDDRDGVARSVATAIADQVPWELQFRLIRRDGMVRYVRTKGEIATDADGQVVAVFGVFRDITVEVEQQQHLQLLASLIETTNESVVSTDAEGRVVWCNPAFTKLTGYTLHELEGLPPGALLQGEETSAETIAELRQHIRAKAPYTCEILNYHKSGRIYWARISLRARFARSGDLLGYFAIQSDVTGTRQLMEQMSAEIAQRQAIEAQLRELVTKDPLSGLANRRGFFEHADHESKLIERYKRAAAIAMIDIDSFKDINDTYGHEAGDNAICHIGSLMRRTLRGSDIVARVGGDEFAVLFKEVDVENAYQKMEKLRSEIHKNGFAISSQHIRLTISIGIAEFLADDTVESAMSRADKALYRAKHDGRNMTVCAQKPDRSA